MYPKHNNQLQGFTLLEVLIALSIFAVLATLTSSSLYYAFTTRERVSVQADRLNELQLALSLIQQDSLQCTDRAVRKPDMLLAPAFIGQAQYFEFTSDGYLNPKSMEKRSTLKRVAYLCQGDSLVYRNWAVLDTVTQAQHEDKIILNHISNCQFNYLDKSLQVLPEWRTQESNPIQARVQLPKAVQVNLKIQDLGEMNLWFIIPGGLYAVA